MGLEIMEGAKPVHEHPFRGPTAFMLGNEVNALVIVPLVNLEKANNRLLARLLAA